MKLIISSIHDIITIKLIIKNEVDRCASLTIEISPTIELAYLEMKKKKGQELHSCTRKAVVFMGYS